MTNWRGLPSSTRFEPGRRDVEIFARSIPGPAASPLIGCHGLRDATHAGQQAPGRISSASGPTVGRQRSNSGRTARVEGRSRQDRDSGAASPPIWAEGCSPRPCRPGIEPISPTGSAGRVDHLSATGPISAMRPAYTSPPRDRRSRRSRPCRGDQHHRRRGRGTALQQRDDLRLDRHVERGGRLVGDDQQRLGQPAPARSPPLAHAAGELVRVWWSMRAPAPGCRCRRAARWRARRLAPGASVGAPGWFRSAAGRRCTAGSARSAGPGRWRRSASAQMAHLLGAGCRCAASQRIATRAMRPGGSAGR